MHKALSDLPVLDSTLLAGRAADWKRSLSAAGPGGNRVVVEWGIGRGPNCFVFPAGGRADGAHFVDAKGRATNDERWADFLEFVFVPKVVEALTAEGFRPQVICVDLRPIQIQRVRRRAIETAAHAKTGEGAAASQH